jgi:hypothetical protein
MCKEFSSPARQSVKIPLDDTPSPRASSATSGAPQHIHHREDEAFYILEGEFEKRGGEVFKARPRTFALLSKEAPTPLPKFV